MGVSLPSSYVISRHKPPFVPGWRGLGENKKKRTIRYMTQLETVPYYRREHGKNRKKKHPPSLEPPQLGFLRNFLALLRVRACAVRDPHRHRAHGRKNRVDIFMRVSVGGGDELCVLREGGVRGSSRSWGILGRGPAASAGVRDHEPGRGYFVSLSILNRAEQGTNMKCVLI